MKYVAGLDLGQRSDYSCLVIAERSGGVFRKYRYAVRAVRRWRGTSYPELVRSVAEILAAPPINGEARLQVDATGVGVAVMDLFNEARSEGFLKVRELQPIIFSAGNEANPRKDTVPKKDLVGRLEVLINQSRLTFASDLRLAGSIKQELKNFQAKVSASGRATFEAAGGHHDDLVTACALAAYETAPVMAFSSWNPGPDDEEESSGFIEYEDREPTPLGWRRIV